jgi:hypothetical protein
VQIKNGMNTLEYSLEISFKMLNIHLLYDPAIPLVIIYPRERKSVASLFIITSRQEATQMLINRWEDEQIALYVKSGTVKGFEISLGLQANSASCHGFRDIAEDTVFRVRDQTATVITSEASLHCFFEL